MRTTISDPRITSASYDELELSLSFLIWEEDQFFYKWKRMLGLTWTRKDLDFIAEGMRQDSKKKSMDELDAESESNVDADIFYPLSLLVRPELIKDLRAKAIPGHGGLDGMGHVPGGAKSLSDLSKEDFLRKLGVTPISPLDPAAESSYGRERTGPGGFREARSPTSLGGRNR